ncbi:hypothetical protein PVK06_009570 [Gossypium arboreum]|uniref:Uncharacterized protein n=1 Tax=Gossypium arboreum TaxID=29729 RepID=A0ABR0QP89_GOSAR|nr:hypothetical protein PVK06_009570 [Gossypium arboreum]
MFHGPILVKEVDVDSRLRYRGVGHGFVGYGHGLPIEYFHELFHVSIGKFVGKPIKVDFSLIGFNTTLAT